MINFEFVVGMVFLLVMVLNEFIEIVGVERYCFYIGYVLSFCFNGDFCDVMFRDVWGWR